MVSWLMRLVVLSVAILVLAAPVGEPRAEFLGCFRDGQNRDLSGLKFEDFGGMTTGRCRLICKSNGFEYAGLQYRGQCFCGGTYNKYGVANNCDMTCAGARTEICGGTWANSLYTSAGTHKLGEFPVELSKYQELGTQLYVRTEVTIDKNGMVEGKLNCWSRSRMESVQCAARIYATDALGKILTPKPPTLTTTTACSVLNPLCRSAQRADVSYQLPAEILDQTYGLIVSPWNIHVDEDSFPALMNEPEEVLKRARTLF